jgi:hypothetical protein
MSVVFSGTNQGRFVSTGAPTTIRLRSDVDYMWVYNQTTSVAGIPAAEVGYKFYWQRGMAQGLGIVHSRLAVTGALQVNAIAANAGFTLVDSSVNVPGAALPTAALVGAGGTLGQSLIQTANTGGMPVVAADTAVAVVRIYASTGYLQFSGIDFDVSRVVAGVSFDLLNGPVAVNGVGPGTYRIIPFDPLYYPRSRFISKIRVSPLNAL